MYYTDHTIVYLNGEWQHVAKAKADLYGQTMHYGLGVFEGIRAYETPLGTQIFKAREHYERLLMSCKVMGIKLNYTADELVEITYELLDRNNFKDAYIRPVVFMGANMSLQVSNDANLFICSWEWGPYLGDKLLRVKTSSYERPNPKSCFVEAKITGHYVNSILAVNEAKAAGFDEALLCDMNGFVAEGPGANFFYESDGVLYTAPRGHILPGITRNTVMDIAKDLEMTVVETHFKTGDVKGSDGAFFTGTAAEVIGLESLDNVPFKKRWEDTLGYNLRNAYKSLVLCQEEHVISVV